MVFEKSFLIASYIYVAKNMFFLDVFMLLYGGVFVFFFLLGQWDMLGLRCFSVPTQRRVFFCVPCPVSSDPKPR